MNLSAKDVAGGNFMHQPIYFNLGLQKGNRPSYIKAAKPEKAIPLF